MEMDIVAFLLPLVTWFGIAAVVSIGLGLIRDLIEIAVSDQSRDNDGV